MFKSIYKNSSLSFAKDLFANIHILNRTQGLNATSIAAL